MTFFVPRWDKYKDNRPDVPSEIDWSHSIFSNVSDVILANSKEGFSVSSLLNDTASNGDEINLRGSSSYIATSQENNAGDWTYIALLRTPVVVGSQSIATFAESAGSGSRDRSLYISNTDVYSYIYDNVAEKYVSVPAQISANATTLVAARANASSLSAWANESSSAIAVANSGFTGYATPDLIVGYGGGGGSNGGGAAMGSSVDIDYFINLKRYVSDDELSELNEAPYKILKYRRKWFLVSSAISSSADLSTSPSSNAQSSGSFSADIPIAGATLVVSSGQGNISAQLLLQSVVSSVSTLNGQLSANVSINVNALAQSINTAGLDLAVSINSQANASSDASGTLSANAGLSATATAQSNANALISINALLSGNAISEAIIQANLSNEQGISADPTSKTTVSAGLTAQIPMAGQAKSYVNSSSGLSAILPVSGVAVSVARGQAGLLSSNNLSGSAQANSASTSDLQVSIDFNAVALAKAIASANIDITNGSALQAKPNSNTNANGNINIKIPLSVEAISNAFSTALLQAQVKTVLVGWLQSELSIKPALQGKLRINHAT